MENVCQLCNEVITGDVYYEDGKGRCFACSNVRQEVRTATKQAIEQYGDALKKLGEE